MQMAKLMALIQKRENIGRYYYLYKLYKFRVYPFNMHLFCNAVSFRALLQIQQAKATESFEFYRKNSIICIWKD